MDFTPFNKLLSLLNKNQKIKGLILIILLFFGMILEILGIGLLLPFLEIISNKNIIEKYPFLEDLFNLISVNSYIGQIVFFLIILFLLYFIKAVYLVYLSHRQNIFLQNINAKLASHLYKIYLNQPYLEFTKFKKSNLIKHLTTDISFFNTFSNGMLSLITETGLLLAIMFSIIIIDPIGAITIALLFVSLSSIFYFFSRRKVKQWGLVRNDLLEKTSNLSLEGFGGFRELLIFQKSKIFTNRYSKDRFKLSDIQAKMNTLSILPRHYLEFISIVIFILYILIKLNQGINLSSLIPTLGVFIAASFKMIPSINKIIIASQNIKFYSNSMDILIKELKLEKNLENNNISTTNIINFPKNKILLKNISFSYSNTDNFVLEDVNLNIEIGKSIGIVGKSGVGKSTLIDLLFGLITPNKGAVYIDEKKYKSIPNSMKNFFGYISQNVFLFDSSISDNIKMSDSETSLNEEKLILEALKDADLNDMINNLEDGINTMVGENGVNLSGGQKQRIAIARALYRKSKILILDEATSNLDNKTESRIIESIKKLKGKVTTIIVSHRLSILNDCDEVYEIKDKKLIQIK